MWFSPLARSAKVLLDLWHLGATGRALQDPRIAQQPMLPVTAAEEDQPAAAIHRHRGVLTRWRFGCSLDAHKAQRIDVQDPRRGDIALIFPISTHNPQGAARRVEDIGLMRYRLWHFSRWQQRRPAAGGEIIRPGVRMRRGMLVMSAEQMEPIAWRIEAERQVRPGGRLRWSPWQLPPRVRSQIQFPEVA